MFFVIIHLIHKRKGGLILNTIAGEIVGDIHIVVCKTPDGDNFFHIQADNENVSSILDIIEDTLVKY